MGVFALLALVGLLAGGAFLVLGPTSGATAPVAPLGHASTPGAHPAAVRAAPIGASTHGDLIVGPSNSPFEITPVTAGGPVYVQAGNVTVQAGGTLVVDNVTLDFLQFIGATGDVSQRTSHLYTFADHGTVDLVNAAITTETSVLNAFPKLALNVSQGGVLSGRASSLAFPGWVNVYGAGSSLNLTGSQIEKNPLAPPPNLTENLTMVGDTEFAPSVTVSGGASALIAGSRIANLYRDNVTAYGVPGVPINSTAAPATISSSASGQWTSWYTINDSEHLARALLEPIVANGHLVIDYNATISQSSATNSLTFGSAFTLPAVDFNAANTHVNVSLPASLVNAINAGGLASFLEATGAFQGSASTVSLSIGDTNSAAGVVVDSITIVLSPSLDYNMTVTGAGSRLTMANTPVDLTWNLTPGAYVPAGTSPPTPWGSSKLLVDNGATAYLANVTTPSPYSSLDWNQSAVLPDATGQVYFYRWAGVPVTAAASVPIDGAHIAAYYAYGATDPDNATATTLNVLSTADPALSWYVGSLDGPAYATTGLDGMGYLLLASGSLTAANLPDGEFLGDYHVAVTLAGGGNGSSQWGYATVAPYPQAMLTPTPDASPSFTFPNYAPSLSVGKISVTVGGAPVTAVTIGENVTVTANVTNTGQGPVTYASADLGYVEPAPLNATVVAGPMKEGALAAGSSFPVKFSWTVNESVTGTKGFFNASFGVYASWNGGTGPNAGNTVTKFTVPIAPSQISLNVQPPTGTLTPGQQYPVTGYVYYNGTGQATINVSAVDSSGVVRDLGTTEAGAARSTQGQWLVFIVPTADLSAGTYALRVTATYNGRTATQTFQNDFTIAGAPTAGPSFLDQKVLGIPILYWILIAVAIVVGIVVALMLLRTTARGKLVECGECGQLIPEDATVCPKCGAEFETDLVRCSRCGSTIPAKSQVCPECAAQLLGKPEEAARDPERQGYSDFVERFRAESKKELGDNYSEGAFWDWWKRQPTYLPFSQWKLQQNQGTRAGMGAPPPGGASTDGTAPAGTSTPPLRRPGGGAAAVTPAPARPTTTRPPAAAARPPAAAPAQAAAPAAAMPASAAMKPCSNCGKEIPPDYLVCPFCGAVTQ